MRVIKLVSLLLLAYAAVCIVVLHIITLKDATVTVPSFPTLTVVLDSSKRPLDQAHSLHQISSKDSRSQDPSSAQEDASTSTKQHFFPRYGMPEFHKQCRWAFHEVPEEQPQNCTFFVRPTLKESEGIALWTTQITTAFMLARQANCLVLLDYGLDVDIHQVLSMPPHAINNWTIPSDNFHCQEENKCFTVNGQEYFGLGSVKSHLGQISAILGHPVISVPWYRNVFLRKSRYQINRTDFEDLPEALPGFRVETGMACALNSLFELANPGAAQFEPLLFTTILPTLQDPRNLVLCLYIRTGLAEGGELVAPNAGRQDAEVHRSRAKPILECAIHHEEQYLTSSLQSGSPYSQLVWMVITDSPYLKTWITENYQDTEARVVPGSHKVTTIPREILTTSSQGRHTRAKGKPSTRDFAEGLIDWYLIGESDLVIMSSYSFGMAGALRTARPIYVAHHCAQAASMFYEETNI